jgi:hypothetical protein
LNLGTITSGDDIADALAHHAAALPSLRHLAFRQECPWLPQLAAFTQLTCLAVSGLECFEFEAAEVASFVPALAQLTHLLRLELWGMMCSE